MKIYTEEEIEKQLNELNVEWTVVDGVHLERVYTFEDFASALAFVNVVGLVAEEHNHHPDIQLSWGKVVLQITSHDAQGLTSKDFTLAKAIEEREKK